MSEKIDGKPVGYDRVVVEESGCVVPLKILKTYGKRNTTYCLVEYFGLQYELPERNMCTREEAEELAIRTLVRKLQLLNAGYETMKEMCADTDAYPTECEREIDHWLEKKLARFVKKQQ